MVVSYEEEVKLKSVKWPSIKTRAPAVNWFSLSTSMSMYKDRYKRNGIKYCCPKKYNKIIEAVFERLEKYIDVKFTHTNKKKECDLKYIMDANSTEPTLAGQYWPYYNYIYMFLTPMDNLEFYKTLFHETLHALGLDHNRENKLTAMGPYLNRNLKQVLYRSDVFALQTIWGADKIDGTSAIRRIRSGALDEDETTTNENVDEDETTTNENVDEDEMTGGDTIERNDVMNGTMLGDRYNDLSEESRNGRPMWNLNGDFNASAHNPITTFEEITRQNESSIQRIENIDNKEMARKKYSGPVMGDPSFNYNRNQDEYMLLTVAIVSPFIATFMIVVTIILVYMPIYRRHVYRPVELTSFTKHNV